MSEKQVVEKAVKEVAKAVGYTAPIPVFSIPDYFAIYEPFQYLIGVANNIDPGDIFSVPAKGLIAYAPGTVAILGKDITGPIAHEIGHLVNRAKALKHESHGKVPFAIARELEKEADQFAASHGYGPQLIAVLEKFAKLYPEENGGEVNEHLNVTERTKIIRAAMPKAKGATA